MNRREFLKIAGVLSGRALLPLGVMGSLLSAPIEARSGDTLYRAANNGKILVSSDAGENWQVHTNFGEELSVVDLASSLSGQIYARLEFAEHAFELVLSPDHQIWRTI